MVNIFGFVKGKIEIQLDNYSYAPGEVIEGTVTLKLKKTLVGKELSITILGEEKISQGYGPNKSYRTVKIFEFKQPLEREKQYHSGEQLSYPFKIKIPANVISKQQTEGTLGKVIKAAQMLSGTTSRISWYLIARLDVKGFDITKKVQINVA